MKTRAKLIKKIEVIPNGKAQLSAVELNLIDVITKLTDRLDKTEKELSSLKANAKTWN